MKDFISFSLVPIVFILLFLYKFKFVRYLLFILGNLNLFIYLKYYRLLEIVDHFPTMENLIMSYMPLISVVIISLVSILYYLSKSETSINNIIDKTIVFQNFFSLLIVLIYSNYNYVLINFLIRILLSIGLFYFFTKIYFKYIQFNYIQFIYIVELFIINYSMFKILNLELNNEFYLILKLFCGITYTIAILTVILFKYFKEKDSNKGV